MLAAHLITAWPWPLTFWHQGQCVPSACHALYVYQVWFDSSSRFSFRAWTHTHIHAQSPDAGMGNDNYSSQHTEHSSYMRNKPFFIIAMQNNQLFMFIPHITVQDKMLTTLPKDNYVLHIHSDLVYWP